jgi:hypothetical protein
MSSSRRSGFGSSLFKGSVNTLASGSGGHEISVKGLRGRSSFSSAAPSVPSNLEVVEGSSAASSNGAGASLATVLTAEQSFSILSIITLEYFGMQTHPCASCSMQRSSYLSVAFDNAETRLTISQDKLSIDTWTLPLDRPDTLYCLSWLSLSLVAYYVYEYNLSTSPSLCMTSSYST